MGKILEIDDDNLLFLVPLITFFRITATDSISELKHGMGAVNCHLILVVKVF